VSVVLPALDEAGGIGAAVASAREAGQVIVVDGGSIDGTERVAREAGAEVISAPRGRGAQLRAGAAIASGEWLVFLHSDTRLESGFTSALRALPPTVAGGAFTLRIDDARRGFRVVERAVAFRSRALGLPYGDQAIFARREAYHAVGGMPALPLMEDVAFVRRLRTRGALAILPLAAITSARRWRRHGIVGTTLRNWALLGAWAVGVPAERLARWYR
jgi:rSAM/selenodomain-associated transferase 2